MHRKAATTLRVNLRLLLLLMLLPFGVGYGQATATITATVTDPDATAWSSLNSHNATYTIQLVSASGASIPAGQAFRTDTGATITNTFSGNLSSSGAFSVSLTVNSYINPVSTQWKFTVCPAVSSPTCASVTLPVTTSASFSTQISAATTAPRIGGGQGAFAYNDTEVAATPNNSYYNITTPALRCYSSSWAACGGGGGTPGGSSTDVQSNQGSAFYGDGNFTYNDSTGVVTASGFATGASTQGYLVLQQNSTAAPAQPANSFELLAPTSGLTSSYNVTVPLLAPTANNSVMTVPNGGGQATWTNPAYTSVANTFSAAQTINFTAGEQMLSLKAGGTNVAWLDMQGGGDTDWQFVAGAAQFNPGVFYVYDATTSLIDMAWKDNIFSFNAGKYVCWTASGGASVASCSVGMFNPGSGILAFATGTGGNASAQLDFGALFSTTTSNTDIVGRLTLSSGTATYTLLKTYTTHPACFANDEAATPTLATCVCTTTVCTAHGTGTDVVDIHVIGFN